MKLKIFKDNNLIETLDAADFVAILSDASAYGGKDYTFSYAYSNACENDKSVKSSDGNEFVAALFKVFKKVIKKRGYQFSFEPCLVVTTYDEMDLYLKNVHTYEKPELIDIKAKEDEIRARCLIDSAVNSFRNDLVFKVDQLLWGFLNAPPMKTAVDEDNKDVIGSIADEIEIKNLGDELTDLIIARLSEIHFTNYIKYETEEEKRTIFAGSDEPED